MKRAGLALCFIVISLQVSQAQWSGYASTEGSTLDGGIGMTWIDDQPYFSISFMPDISIGNFGIGLNLSLLYNTDTKHIRTEDWDSSYDYARLIRYIRYGHKGDPVYGRIGALDAARVGHGFILNFYNNQINYDERKIGLSLDIDFGQFGIESMTNNLGRLEVLGVRGYYRPLYASQIPIVKNFAVGASYITDVDPDEFRDTDDEVSIWGVDVEQPLIKNKLLKVLLYADHAAMVNPVSEAEMMAYVVGLAGSSSMEEYKNKGEGSGQTVGILTQFDVLFGLMNLTAQFERRWLGKGFIANYFGPLYEVMRYGSVGETAEFYQSLGGDISSIEPYLANEAVYTAPVGRNMMMPLMNEKQTGYYGGLNLNLIHFIQVTGSYQKLDKVDGSGMLHFGAGLSQDIPLISLEASYDKVGVNTFKDVRTLDNKSVARVGVGYKINPFLLLYVDYIWTFRFDKELGIYKPQERIMPRLAFRMPINIH